MLVAEIYNKHISPVQEDLTVQEVLEIFIRKDVNSVVVLDREEKLVGILSLQDIAASIVPVEIKENPALANAMYKPNFFQEVCQELKDKRIKTIMRTEFITVTTETNLMEVAADFLANDLYIVPVCEGEKIIGIVTRSNIRRAFGLAMKIQSTSKTR